MKLDDYFFKFNVLSSGKLFTGPSFKKSLLLNNKGDATNFTISLKNPIESSIGISIFNFFRSDVRARCVFSNSNYKTIRKNIDMSFIHTRHDDDIVSDDILKLISSFARNLDACTEAQKLLTKYADSIDREIKKRGPYGCYTI